jgi:hypothetical protein
MNFDVVSQLLICTNHVNLMVYNLSTIRKNTEALFGAYKAADLDINRGGIQQYTSCCVTIVCCRPVT